MAGDHVATDASKQMVKPGPKCTSNALVSRCGVELSKQHTHNCMNDCHTAVISSRQKANAIGRYPKVVVSTKNHSPYGITCIRCNDRLIAPNWSKYVGERHIRHFWSCERCGHQFETSDDLPINASRPKTCWKVSPLPLLVA